MALNQRPRTQVGDRLDGVQVLRRDAGGRVVEVALTGSRAPVVTGEDFRLAIMAAAGPAQPAQRALRGASASGTQLRFTGRGSGHGVGLCQIGLIGRLRAGQTPAQALLAYYPGATMSSPEAPDDDRHWRRPRSQEQGESPDAPMPSPDSADVP